MSFLTSPLPLFPFNTEIKASQESSPESVLEKLKSTHPSFPLFLKRFVSPHFIYYNEVEYQGIKYGIYGRRHQKEVSIEFNHSETPRIELKDLHSGDCRISQATPLFIF